MIFVFDNSSLSGIFNHYYPESFPSFWERFNAMVNRTEVLSVKEVRRELDDKQWRPDSEDWIKNNKTIFEKPTVDELEFVATIYAISHFQQNISRKNLLNGKPVADPFVIAKAKVKDATVVTEEKLKPNAARIPNICAHFSIECIDLQGFLSIQGWVF